MHLTRWHNATWVNSKQVGSAGGRCKLPQRCPGWSPGRKRILEHFPAKKRIWSLVAAILSLNSAKNNPKIVTKITAVRPRGASHKGPLNTPLVFDANANPVSNTGRRYIRCKCITAPLAITIGYRSLVRRVISPWVTSSRDNCTLAVFHNALLLIVNHSLNGIYLMVQT